jgi:uncharacterized RDD family membrane protein YckC
MQCPSCGAISKKRSLKCAECGAFRNKSSVDPAKRFVSKQTDAVEALTPKSSVSTQPRSLIEFPGARNTMPQWRKELGERVREVQERKLRESALESGAVESNDVGKAPLLELLPQAEVSPLNPLVVAALARIERAHTPAHGGGGYSNFKGATAVAYAEQPDFSPEISSIGNVTSSSCSSELDAEPGSPQPERVHNLAVVPNPPAQVESQLESIAVDEESSVPAQKPKRLIGGDVNDPALNYLDTIPTAVNVDDFSKRIAPIHLRFVASVIDLVVVGLLSWVPLALAGLINLAWQDRRALILSIVTTVVVAFLYSTISTALTGRTLGMKLFSLRVIDARTRMLPTGSQSAGRAAVYILSVISTGIPLMYALIDRDKRAAHDRFTRTDVVRT